MTILIIPGFGDSGPLHWQTLWENGHPEYRRVVQYDWEHPDCAEWVETLNRSIHTSKNPTLLVAHSLGCAVVAHWVKNHGGAGVHGALLVSPSDVDLLKHTTPEIRSFSPLPLLPFPFPSIVVASSNDLYLTLKRAQHFASCWGSRFVNIGRAGHINADSDLGDWAEGKALLKELTKLAE